MQTTWHHFIGVDAGKAYLDLAVHGGKSLPRIKNTVAAIERWLARLPGPCAIGIEATGAYHQALVKAAEAAGHTVFVLNPRDVQHYSRSLGRRAKTDRLDALLIARYVAQEHQELHPFCAPSHAQARLSELLQRRRVVTRACATLRQSFKGLSQAPAALASALDELQALIDEIDRQMQALIAGDQQLAPLQARLGSIIGIGSLTSTALAVPLSRFELKHSDAFVAYLGLDPRVRDSGQHRGRRFLSKRGPGELRRLLYVAAMAACRTKAWQPLYRRYRDRGLPTTAVLVIIARKIARIAFSIARYNTHFDPTRLAGT
jgi:transposase